jgi:hypothetical protein
MENSLWKRLRTCRKTDYRMNELINCLFISGVGQNRFVIFMCHIIRTNIAKFIIVKSSYLLGLEAYFHTFNNVYSCPKIN